MRSMLLLMPSRSYFYFAIRGMCTVPDDKVITKLVPSSSLVVFVESIRSTSIGGAVMDNDTFPPVRQIVWLPVVRLFRAK